MTQEEKARRYDEALETARKINCGEEVAAPEGWTVCEVIFPELKESEDERIRQKFIKLIKMSSEVGGFALHKWEADEMLAWIEKQGKNNSCKFTFEDVLALECSMKTAKITKGGDELYKILVPLYNKVHDAYLIEKQGEQKHTIEMKSAEESLGIDSDTYNKIVDKCIYGEHKPADKVEPKFKVKYAGSEYNVLDVKDIAGVTFYGIEDEPNHIDYVKAENCKIIGSYVIKENGSPYPTNPAAFSEQKPVWSEEDEKILMHIIQDIELLLSDKNERFEDERKQSLVWLKSLKQRMEE